MCIMPVLLLRIESSSDGPPPSTILLTFLSGWMRVLSTLLSLPGLTDQRSSNCSRSLCLRLCLGLSSVYRGLIMPPPLLPAPASSLHRMRVRVRAARQAGAPGLTVHLKEMPLFQYAPPGRSVVGARKALP